MYTSKPYFLDQYLTYISQKGMWIADGFSLKNSDSAFRILTCTHLSLKLLAIILYIIYVYSIYTYESGYNPLTYWKM